MVKTKINGKWDLLLPEHRAKRPEWHTEKGWERERLDSMYETTKGKEFYVVYYVGAEEGEMPALLSEWGADLVLMEPNPLVWPNVKAIWEGNNLKFPLAFFPGFASGETDLGGLHAQDMGNFPVSAEGPVISDHGFKNLCEADGTIPQVRIDDLVESLTLIPSMISIDVEGSEWEVLRGAEQTLRNYHPRIYLSLHPEFLFQIYGEYSLDLRVWIRNLGYKETLLAYEHEVHLLYEKAD